MAERITRQKEDRILKDVLEAYLPDTEELLIVSGYFYFSGFDLIHSHLKDKKIKILCGMDTDNKTLEMLSPAEIQQHWNKHVLEKFQRSDYFDDPDIADGVALFIEKAKNGSLEIRFDPNAENHSKEFTLNFYKNKTQNGMSPGVNISGSSNFTLSGLTRARGLEGNMISRDERDLNDANDIFNTWWDESSADLLNKKLFDNFNKEVYQKSFIGQKDPTPYELFVKVLNTYFPYNDDYNVLSPKQITGGKFMDLLYQVDAIEEGLNIISKHNGVILADVVGLGKSIIAASIAKNLNKNTLIICKPASEDDWNMYKTQYGIEGNVISRGKLHKIIENRIEYLKDYEEENLVIIDEAHEFRNDQGVEFAKLHEICSGNKVLLLTATPMSNDPADTCNLIKLFQEPGMTTLQTIDNLSEKFKEILKKWKTMKKDSVSLSSSLSKDELAKGYIEQQEELKNLEQEIRDDMRLLIDPLLVRRSRLDLQNIKRYQRDLQVQNIEFPKVNTPEIVEYSIDHILDMYIETLNIMQPSCNKSNLSLQDRFIGARYMAPHPNYLKSDAVKEICKNFNMDEDEIGSQASQENLADMMRRLVSRRFESSPPAFIKTLSNMIDNHELILNWYEKVGIVPIFVRAGAHLPNIDNLIDENGDFIDNLNNKLEFDNLKAKGGWWIDKKFLKEKFITTVHNDISLLKKIYTSWNKYINSEQFKDTKIEELKLILDK